MPDAAKITVEIITRLGKKDGIATHVPPLGQASLLASGWFPRHCLPSVGLYTHYTNETTLQPVTFSSIIFVCLHRIKAQSKPYTVVNKRWQPRAYQHIKTWHVRETRSLYIYIHSGTMHVHTQLLQLCPPVLSVNLSSSHFLTFYEHKRALQ